MKKNIVLALILTGFLAFLAPNLSKVQAITVEQLQAQIQQLLQIIQQLQQQINALITKQPQPPAGSYCFSNDLKYGISSPDVKNLQIVLGVPVTGYFDDATLAAVKQFQSSNGITITGYVGPLTRSVMNNKYCVPVVTTTVTKPVTSGCGWCGNTCVRKTADMYCAQVMPPSGIECKEANGVCQMVAGGNVIMDSLKTQLAQLGDLIQKLSAAIINLGR